MLQMKHKQVGTRTTLTYYSNMFPLVIAMVTVETESRAQFADNESSRYNRVKRPIRFIRSAIKQENTRKREQQTRNSVGKKCKHRDESLSLSHTHTQ